MSADNLTVYLSLLWRFLMCLESMVSNTNRPALLLSNKSSIFTTALYHILLKQEKSNLWESTSSCEVTMCSDFSCSS